MKEARSNGIGAQAPAPEGRGAEVARPSLLWFGLLGAAAAWFIQHSLGYGLVEVNCHSNRLAFEILGAEASLFVALTLTGLAALVALAAAVLAAISVRRSRPGGLLREAPEEPGAIEARGRSRFMAYVGFLLSSLFLMAILTSGAAFLFIKPC